MPRFLVVDDSPTVRYMLANALKYAVPVGTSGVEVVEAATPEAAMEAFAAATPEATFLDMVMDGVVTGTTLLGQMLSRDPTARIVVLTGLPPTDADVVAAVSAGAFAYLPKPVRVDAIRTVLKELQSESSATRRISRVSL